MPKLTNSFDRERIDRLDQRTWSITHSSIERGADDTNIKRFGWRGQAFDMPEMGKGRYA